MRSRTNREGSVGLLILAGIAVFGGIVLWLRGIKLGATTYKIIAEFPDVNGIQVGDAVRYRGLKVGKISRINPGTNGVDIIMEMIPAISSFPKQLRLKLVVQD